MEAKKRKFLVGITSNGTLISEDVAKKIVENELDIISFSLAGFEKNNDLIRKNASFKKVIHSIELITKYKKLYNKKRPEIHIAYMWLKSVYKDLKKLVNFLKNFEIEEVVVHPLTFVPAEHLQKEVIYFQKEFVEFAKEVYKISEEQGIKIQIYFVFPNKINACPDDILRSLFINCNGNVSPCTLSLIPVNSQVFYFFEGKRYPYKPLLFGNVIKEKFLDVWLKRDYKNFRKNYYRDFCNQCYKLYLTPFKGEYFIQDFLSITFIKDLDE